MAISLICNGLVSQHPPKIVAPLFIIFLEHAKGFVPVGEISIIIAVGAGHRDEAFKICRYILEEVKHQSLIWKKEHYVEGTEGWLPGHSLRPKKEIK